MGRKNPQELTQFSLRSHSRHLVGKRTAQNKTPVKIAQAVARLTAIFPYMWSPASLILNIYFYLFSTTRITKHIPTRVPKNQNRRAALGRPTLALLLLWFTRQTTMNNKSKLIKHKRKAKRAAGIEGQMASMLESHTRQIATIDTTAIKRARKKIKQEGYDGRAFLY